MYMASTITDCPLEVGISTDLELRHIILDSLSIASWSYSPTNYLHRAGYFNIRLDLLSALLRQIIRKRPRCIRGERSGVFGVQPPTLTGNHEVIQGDVMAICCVVGCYQVSQDA